MALRVVLLVVACTAVTPFQPASLKPPCPLSNSCVNRNASDSSSEPVVSCYCDALCNTYADCCLDAEYRDASKQKKGQHNEFWCTPFSAETFFSYLKEPGCKEGWADEEVEELCFRNGNASDPLSKIIVTSKATSITYQNYYCAICNEDILDLRMWNGKLSCDLPEDAEFNLNETVYKYHTLGVFYGSPEERDFRSCKLESERPPDIKNLARLCTPFYQTYTCNPDFKDEEVASLCQSYTAVVYYEGSIYRNPHCALCNHEMGDYSCSPSLLGNFEGDVESVPWPGFQSGPFTITLDFNDPSNTLVGSSIPCSAMQVWDPFFNLCRSIVCPKPRQEYRSGRCEDVSYVNSTRSRGQATVLTLPSSHAPLNPFNLSSLIPACPSRNSCHRRKASNSTTELPFSCHCDALCNTYADCCLDAEHRDASKQIIDQHNEFWCRTLGDETFPSYIKPPRCKEGWTDKEVEELCLSFDKFTDPLSNLLVTSKTTSITYRNYYCAICNEDVLKLRMWNGKLSCDLPEDAKVNLNDLVFKNGSWGVLYGSSKEGDFRSCNIDPVRPQDVKNLTRTCTRSYPIKKCPYDWQDEAVASKCQSYTSVIYHSGLDEYRNPHCALCNFYEMNDYSCLPAEFGSIWDPSPSINNSRPLSTGQMFDFTSRNLLDSSAPCSSTQVWDPFFRQCRSIVCPKPHQDYRNGRCEDLDQASSVTPIKVAPRMPACPSRNSCQRRNVLNFPAESIFSCHCDALCNIYADCCLDAEYRDASKQIKDRHHELLTCTSTGGAHETYVYMKEPGCTEGWADKEVEDLCFTNGIETDPLSRIKVTSKATSITYQNYYCAVCNEDVLDLRMWNGNISCQVPEDTEVKLNELVFKDYGWSVAMGVFLGSPEDEDFRECILDSVLPQDVKNLTRNCDPHFLTETCHDDWQDEVVASLCQSYTAVVYHGWKSYKNPHCALCNYEMDDYSCLPESPESYGGGGHGGYIGGTSLPFSFALLIDFTDPSNNLVGFSEPCSSTRVWDPFSQRCRSIICPKPRQEYSYGRCEDVGDVSLTSSKQTTQPALATTPSLVTSRAPFTESTPAVTLITTYASNIGRNQITDMNINRSGIISDNSDITSDLTSDSHKDVISNISNIRNINSDLSDVNSDVSSNISNISSDLTSNINCDVSSDISSDLTSNNSDDINKINNRTNISFDVIGNKTHKNNSCNSSISSDVISSNHSSDIFNKSNNITTSTAPAPTTNPGRGIPNTRTSSGTFPILSPLFLEDPDETTSPAPPGGPSSTATSHFQDIDSPLAADAPLSTNFTTEFIECYKVYLEEGEFELLDNGIVYVEAYDRSYDPGQYATMGDGGMLVCVPVTSTSSNKFSAVLGWVSMAGLGLSSAALLLHLTVFALMPELKNLPGKNLASLCLALLAAYVTFLMNPMVSSGRLGCLMLAAAMYYFFVASFTWMNAIAFDVWHTVRLTQLQLREFSGPRWQRFIAYSLYSWLLPAAATLALLLLDQLEPQGIPEEFLPRLGRSWCWFSHRKALLVFFAVPMVTIIVLNCFLFVSAACIIKHTATAPPARGGHHQSQYKVYLRLSVLMGFTWVSGIAAAYFSLEGLWYVFVLLNTLQGVFIFLAFTVRTKVMQGVATATRRLLQQSLYRVSRSPMPPPQLDNHALGLNQMPERYSTSVSSVSIDEC